MTLRKRDTSPAIPGRSQTMNFKPGTAPERLVGVGFRCWFAGYQTDDINCWETGWNLFAKELGPSYAKTAVSELSCWVRLVHKKACRPINYYPFGCAGFCKDECMAISMIAASQHSECPALRSCAFALLGSSDIDGVVESATDFGNALREFGHVLSDRSICDGSFLAGLKTPHPDHAKH